MIAIIPNLITSLRIIGAVSLMFIEPLSITFFIVYTLSGLSDAIDGMIARKFKVTSHLGTVLDSIADLLFYAVMLIKIFPVLYSLLPKFIWAVVGVIIFIRVCSYTVAALKYRRFASIHTYLNKLTSVIIFTVPYFLNLPVGPTVCYTVCAVAGIASFEELMIHLCSKKYDESQKTIFASLSNTAKKAH